VSEAEPIEIDYSVLGETKATGIILYNENARTRKTKGFFSQNDWPEGEFVCSGDLGAVGTVFVELYAFAAAYYSGRRARALTRTS